jgi:hypothetical protein
MVKIAKRVACPHYMNVVHMEHHVHSYQITIKSRIDGKQEVTIVETMIMMI